MEHPTLEQAKAKEHENRVIAFADTEIPLFGGRWWVRPMNYRDAARLELAGCAIVRGGVPSHEDAFKFLSCMLGLSGDENARKRKRLWRQLREYTGEQIAEEVGKYCDGIFQDRVMAAKQSDEVYASEKNPVHFCAHSASFFMRHFGMTFEAAMTTPIPVLNQLKRSWFIAQGRGDEIVDKSDILRARLNSLLASEKNA